MATANEKAGAPKVSVLLPVYNTHESHLRETLDSILNQTFADYELLIVDDASSDGNVRRIIHSYDDPRIVFSANDRNQGISETRNRLLDMARGDYLAIMDHDDISLPQRFEKEAAYLDAHPDVGVVSCHVEYFGDRTGVEKTPSEDIDIRLALMETSSLFHSASMIRRRVLADRRIRYEEEFTPAEDYALWCRLLPYTRFHNIPEVLFKYRFHAGNTSSTQKERILRAALAVRSFAAADNPALHAMYRESATHITKVKLFGFIPFLTFTTRGRRSRCSLFGIPLYRSKRHSRLGD